MAIILYSLLCGAFYYLGSRATITRVVWHRYPPALARFMDCPACTGTWYGLGLALTLGRYLGLDFLGLDALHWLTPIVVAGCTMILTPIVAATLQYALTINGSAIEDEQSPEPWVGDFLDGIGNAIDPKLKVVKPPDDAA